MLKELQRRGRQSETHRVFELPPIPHQRIQVDAQVAAILRAPPTDEADDR